MYPNEDTDKANRIERFRRELDACNVLIDCMNYVLDRYEGKLKLTDSEAEQDLQLLVCAMFGKAGKTFNAVIELCCLGFGEDALILLRSNGNLMINLLYILAKDSVERAADFIAYGHREQAKYLKLNHNDKPPPEWMKFLKWDEIEERARRWEKLTIKQRAGKANQSHHYDVAYRFYSSIEHSDAMAISRYVEEWDENGPKINSSPSDNYVKIALIDNFRVLAIVFFGFCKHFSIDEPDGFSKIQTAWNTLSE